VSEQAVWIVDFGSQYTQLITKKIREVGHSSVIITVENAREKMEQGTLPQALILSGGPQSVFVDQGDYSFLFADPKLPILGICFGMQLIGQYYSGKVVRGTMGEYGPAKIKLTSQMSIPGLPANIQVWMSHSDHLLHAPENFSVVMESLNGLIAAIKSDDLPIMGLQFHPEVEHSDHGKEILAYFLEEVANLKKDWSRKAMLEDALAEVGQVGEEVVLCAFSGGVDSLVAATLAARILKDRLYCFFVNNGLLRPQDLDHIEALIKETNLNIEVIDASQTFLTKLAGVDDPEKKRKIIGNLFIEVFEQKVHQFEQERNIHFSHLLQGTLYPDVIESISPHGKGGKSATIKSHHNVGGLPERMKLKLLEPLRFLFKDEVRSLGRELGLRHSWVYRHPFPGPGIGIRVLGRVTPEYVAYVQQSDQILFEELHHFNLYDSVWQALTVMLPVKTVGVKGDARAYEEVICVRIVGSVDGMTADWSDLPKLFLKKVSNRITNEVKGITRVVYDITSKPPGTIEWE
jgi:GMP synthase (glutamine-hydrolysing)